MKPFLKWAGNKFQIIERVKNVLPSGGRLIEPFVGSAAVFLNTDYSRYVLADSNADLINLYRTLKEEGDDFICYSRKLFTPKNNSEKAFYSLRDKFNSTHNTRLKSALFIYLNKHGFNGLCRYNLKGEFNVPFGRYTKPYFPEIEMSYFQTKARKAVFRQADFEKTMRSAKPGDIVYCDPPYVPLSVTANFTSYSVGGFGQEQQMKLALLAEELAKGGVTVVISNHDTEFVHRAYAKARIFKFDVQRFISCDGANRGKAAEVLAVFVAA